ncbi:MAG: hypothetical protein WBP94_11315 [Rhodomicrobiaceae bacterium]
MFFETADENWTCTGGASSWPWVRSVAGGGPSFAQTAARNAQQRVIDAHCHFFNAKDLPVQGFVQQVVLGDYAELKALPR